MYEATIIDSSAKLSAKEKVMFKDVVNCIKLDSATQEGPVFVDVAAWVQVGIHNDKATPTDYDNYVIVDKSGERYVTGSASFWSAFTNIWKEMAEVDEEWKLKIYRMPSKNRAGKDFITCAVE